MGGRVHQVVIGTAVLLLAVTACQSGGSAGSDASTPRPGHAAANDDSRLASHRPDPGTSSTAPGTPTGSAPRPDAGTTSGKPRAATMPAARYIQTGGVAGYRELSVDRYGRWTTRGGDSGRLTAAQVRELDGLLRSDALATEARRYAAAASPERECLGKPHLSQQLSTDQVALRKTSCDTGDVATPTYDRIVRLLGSWTGS